MFKVGIDQKCSRSAALRKHYTSAKIKLFLLVHFIHQPSGKKVIFGHLNSVPLLPSADTSEPRVNVTIRMTE